MLQGKTVIVTGVGGGLGRECVTSALREGANVDLADFTKRPLDWTIGGLTPAMTFFSNVQIAATLGISVGVLPCKHFPQVTIPDVLADHVRQSASRHL